MPGCQWCADLQIPSPWNSTSAPVESADGPRLQVKLRNGSADRPCYEASQLSLTTCNVEGLVGLHSVVLCTISAFWMVADNVS